MNEDCIGSFVEVLDENNNVKKTIKIKNIFESANNGTMYLGDDGILYSEVDLNFKYELTIGALFSTFLYKYGYVTKSKMFDKSMDEYENEVKDFMNMLIKNGYVKTKNDD